MSDGRPLDCERTSEGDLAISKEKQSDQELLIRKDSSSSDNDSDYNQPVYLANRGPGMQESQWWFQEPAVKKNCCLVLGAWFLLIMGILSFITGLILEIIHHSDDVIRGLVFFLIAILLLIPSVYAVTHVYLAAKRVGRVRFSSVWFFR